MRRIYACKLDERWSHLKENHFIQTCYALSSTCGFNFMFTMIAKILNFIVTYINQKSIIKPISLSPVCVCLFLKKRMGNCLILLKRVCFVQYNLSHPSLTVTMAFEWSCGMLLCQNSFPSPLCVCLFLEKKKTIIKSQINLYKQQYFRLLIIVT